MSQQPSTTTTTTTPAPNSAAAGRKRKKSPKPKDTKRAPGDGPKRTKVAQRREKDAAGAPGPAGMVESQALPHRQNDEDEVGSSPHAHPIIAVVASSTAIHQKHPLRSPPTPTASPSLQSPIRAQGAQIRELSLCMRETGLIMRELLKVKLGQPASMPPTPTLDAGVADASPESTCQPGGTPTPAENGLSAGALGLFHNNTTDNRAPTMPPNIGDQSILGIGQPPPRVPVNTSNSSMSFANGVAFNIGSITEPVTVAPLPPPEAKVESTNPSPPLPGSAHQSQGHYHPLQLPNLDASATGDPHPPLSAHTPTPMFRHTSQPIMSETSRNTSFSMPSGQHTSIQTPQIPSTQHEDQNMAPTPATAPPQGGHGFTLPNQAYSPFPQSFMRPALTPQQQAIQQQIQQQQQQAQIMAQFQRQTAMSRQSSPYYAQHQQMMAGLHPSLRTVSGNPVMTRPPRPLMNINSCLGIMPPGDEAERNGPDPLAHAIQPRMSPNVQQLERLQRQALGYARQMTGQQSNPATNFLPSQFPGPAPLAQNPFLGTMGLTMSPPEANRVGATNHVTSDSCGGPPPTQALTMPSGAATNGMSTPNMYNLYVEPSPFSATFPGMSGANDMPSPFSFAPPDMGEGGGVSRSRWGEEDADEEPLREVTPGKRLDSK
ncbi:hypothetical protein CspeluHIS016_0400090 [Cutaneotrichosporon spelunceum]|uniref:Uncharacterized protein n=1 Tax=Cutaneotrichosporon spelunceum TaxID=1672016 RepID=A0AAD3TVD4_9TREE|nr:hypothetical protein CspeluHIS016_0400090 [Cutaneotrichosporon spelunceum]